MVKLKGLIGILKQIKSRKPRPKFCPVCKGHNIYPTSILGFLPTTYACGDCGYRGVIALEIEEGKEEPDE